ncbi:MAG: hypothetical protein RBT39_13505 [Azoarcus sp.]|nr:hypothetical protein [Azoarcus sp.]MDX9838573.1 hypothetical protein [Azoarcus sp.]
MAIETAELGRCPSCQRWDGTRRLSADGCGVELDSENNRGICTEGPWHGSSRGPRNACGRWLQWVEIRPLNTSDS